MAAYADDRSRHRSAAVPTASREWAGDAVVSRCKYSKKRVGGQCSSEAEAAAAPSDSVNHGEVAQGIGLEEWKLVMDMRKSAGAQPAGAQRTTEEGT
jgi:hypothetical protein